MLRPTLLYSFCVFCFLVLPVQSASTGCSWDVNKDLAEHEPLFVKKVRRDYSLFQPNSTRIELKGGQTLYAVCPGPRNAVSGKGKSFVKVTCDVGTHVKVDNENWEIKEIRCDKNVVSDTRPANRTDDIPTQAEILNVGFQTELGWLGLYDISYDFARSTPIYAMHTIHGRSIRGTYTGNSRPNFKTNGVRSDIQWNKIFKKDYQNQVFQNLIGPERTEEYLRTTSLSRGHLAPDADFHFHSWELATYFYANVVPQWQAINAGNWLRVENAVRQKAKELNDDLLVLTGAEGVASFKVNNVDRKIYLVGDNVPVPEFIWKIVCTRDNDCIALVINNNPFEPSDRHVCNNACGRQRDSSRWYLSSYDDAQKGLVVCCDVNDLKNNFQNIPNIRVNGLLRY